MMAMTRARSATWHNPLSPGWRSSQLEGEGAAADARTAKINTALSTNSGGGRSNLVRQIRCKMPEGDGRYERRNARRIRMGKAIKCS